MEEALRRLQGGVGAAWRLHLGMGPRYVILVTKNEAKNESGCYQNRITSYFNCLSGFASCNLVIFNRNFKKYISVAIAVR